MHEQYYEIIGWIDYIGIYIGAVGSSIDYMFPIDSIMQIIQILQITTILQIFQILQIPPVI